MVYWLFGSGRCLGPVRIVGGVSHQNLAPFTKHGDWCQLAQSHRNGDGVDLHWSQIMIQKLSFTLYGTKHFEPVLDHFDVHPNLESESGHHKSLPKVADIHTLSLKVFVDTHTHLVLNFLSLKVRQCSLSLFLSGASHTPQERPFLPVGVPHTAGESLSSSGRPAHRRSVPRS